MIGQINLDKKVSGKRSAGKPHAAFDEAGTGNVIKELWIETHKRKRWKQSPKPNVGAPVLDPTLIRELQQMEEGGSKCYFNSTSSSKIPLTSVLDDWALPSNLEKVLFNLLPFPIRSLTQENLKQALRSLQAEIQQYTQGSCL